MLPAALIAALWDGPVAIIFAIALPVAALVYATFLLVFGLPLLWLWPAAFSRGLPRGLLASMLGGSIALLAAAITSWSIVPPAENIASLVLLGGCGGLAGFVWWWLNFDAAP